MKWRRVSEVFFALFAILMICGGVVIWIAYLTPWLTARPPTAIAGSAVVLVATAAWGLARLIRRRDLTPASRVGPPWLLVSAAMMIPMALSEPRGALWKVGMIVLAVLLAVGCVVELVEKRIRKPSTSNSRSSTALEGEGG